MAIAIAAVRAATVDEWSRAFDAAPRATFFHGPVWSQIWQAYTAGRYEPSPRLVEFSDGRTALLGITTERMQLGIERRHLSPAGTYGGWLSADDLRHEHAALLTGEILRLRGFVWRRSPTDERDGFTPAGALRETTHVIDLRAGPEAARQRWAASAQRQVRKAVRNGIRVREGSRRDDWLAYDGLYRTSIERWGVATTTYNSSLFVLLGEMASPSVRLFLAEADGRVVAGAIVFTAHAHAAYWHGASASAAAPGASNLLHWDILERLADERIDVYDLNPSAGLTGIARFKESLGAVAAPAPIVIKRHPLETVARRTERWLRRLRAARSRA